MTLSRQAIEQSCKCRSRTVDNSDRSSPCWRPVRLMGLVPTSWADVAQYVKEWAVWYNPYRGWHATPPQYILVGVGASVSGFEAGYDCTERAEIAVMCPYALGQSNGCTEIPAPGRTGSPLRYRVWHRAKGYMHGNPRYASSYEDSSPPRTRCDPRRWVRHADPRSCRDGASYQNCIGSWISTSRLCRTVSQRGNGW